MTLPLPRSWFLRTLDNHPDSESEVPMRDLALLAKNPRYNSKTMLRIKLLGAGWDPAVVSLATKDTERPDLAVTDVYTRSAGREVATPVNLSTKRDLLKKAGFSVKTERVGPSAAGVLWRSLTHVSPWMVDHFAKRLIIATGTNYVVTQRASAGFIMDTWRSQNMDEAKERMPRFGRFNLLSWMSPDALGRWKEVTKDLDIAVIYGGLHSDADLHPVLGYLAALSSVFHGFIIYELLLPADVNVKQVDASARRYGVTLVCGYTAKLMVGEGALNGEQS